MTVDTSKVGIQGDDSIEGSKYFVDIEGTIYPWVSATITVPELRALAGIPSDTPMLEIDADNNQRQLPEDEVIELKPGQGFSKRIKYRRGVR